VSPFVARGSAIRNLVTQPPSDWTIFCSFVDVFYLRFLHPPLIGVLNTVVKPFLGAKNHCVLCRLLLSLQISGLLPPSYFLSLRPFLSTTSASSCCVSQECHSKIFTFLLSPPPVLARFPAFRIEGVHAPDPPHPPPPPLTVGVVDAAAPPFPPQVNLGPNSSIGFCTPFLAFRS